MMQDQSESSRVNMCSNGFFLPLPTALHGSELLIEFLIMQQVTLHDLHIIVVVGT